VLAAALLGDYTLLPDLKAANYVIHFDHWWNPAVEDQANGRILGIGQKKDAFIIHLWVENSVGPSGWQLASQHVLTGVPENDWTLRLTPGVCLDFVPIGPDFSRGPDAAPLVASMRAGPTAFGPLICYEDLFPGLARDSVRAGSDVLVVLTNDAWYGEEAAAYQHAAHSVLRAVETRRPVLRCGNAGWSGWIDEFGGIRYVVTGGAGGVYTRAVRSLDVSRDERWVGRNTFYVDHGDWFVAACAVLALFAYALLRPFPVPGRDAD